MNKQTKGSRIGGSGGGVDGNTDYVNSQLGKTKSGVALNKIAQATPQSRKSRSDNTPNPRVG